MCAQQRPKFSSCRQRRLGRCSGISESLLGAHAILLVLSYAGSFANESHIMRKEVFKANTNQEDPNQSVMPNNSLLSWNSIAQPTLLRSVWACQSFFFFFFIWVLRPFQEYFIYIEPIIHQRWAKTGEPGEKNTWPSVSRTWLSHMWPEWGSNHSSENPNGLRVSSLIH